MTRHRRRRPQRARQEAFPGWLWMLFGLSLGLSVAVAIYVKDHRPAAVAADEPSAEPASLKSAIDDNAETGSDKTPGKDAAPAENRFTFYDMLPNFEVVIPEQEHDVAADVSSQAIVEPGIYVLQAGSFSTYADADRRRAELALNGIESSIQRVTIDDKTYHRVRIGPIDDLDQLNMLRSRLHAAHIDVLRIRLGD